MTYFLGNEDAVHCANLVKYLDSCGELESISDCLKKHAKVPDESSSVTKFSFGGSRTSSTTSLNDSFSSFNSACSSKSHVFHLRPRINVLSLANISYNLAKLIMEEPKIFRKLLQIVIFHLADSLGCEEISVQNQIVVFPEITGLAPIYEHRVRDGKHLGHLVKSGKIWSGKVQLVGLSEKVKYVSSTTYVCTSPDCDGCRDNMIYVKVFSPVLAISEA